MSILEVMLYLRLAPAVKGGLSVKAPAVKSSSSNKVVIAHLSSSLISSHSSHFLLRPILHHSSKKFTLLFCFHTI
jgi:hypothetical protein